MSLHPILSMAHSGAAILLFSLAIISLLISVLIAVKPAADHANEGLTKKANTVGLIENIVVGIVTLTGVITVFTGSWSFSQLWVWMSLLIVAFYSAALIFITKPARLAVAKGGSAVKVGMQVTLQLGHVLLLIVAFAFMVLKPT
jgi:hypothetical protein